MSKPLLAGAILVLTGLVTALPAPAAGAPAGSQIANSAQVSYSLGAATLTEASNTVSITIAEIVDVVVTLQTPSISVAAGATDQVLVYRITNTGNGPETFRLTIDDAIGGDDFDPVAAMPAIYFDTDASGTLTAADTPYTPGSNEPALAADASATVLVVHAIPASLANGSRGFSLLRAAALTGTAAPGTAFAGQGAGGTDAVLGTSGGDADATGLYLVADLRLTAVKSATVVDPYGGARPVPGARIHYQIVVTSTGAGTASAVVFTDPIPASTTYVPASLQLNGASLTDADNDADAGSYQTTPVRAVRAALGTLTQASGPQTVTFAVTID